MRSEIDFTEGSIGRKLLSFALPLFLGNLFQQLYNAADSLIVGNFLGREALAAVSSSAPIIFMLHLRNYPYSLCCALYSSDSPSDLNTGRDNEGKHYLFQDIFRRDILLCHV